MAECTICVESYNSSTRELITCSNCDLECCKTCFKRYISDPAHYLRCMGCSVEFDRTMLHTRLGQNYMRTTYRDIREDMLYEQEKALFPAAQEAVEREKIRRGLIDSLNGLDDEYETIRKERMVPLKEFRHSMENMAIRDALDKYFELQLNIESIDEQLNERRRQINVEIENIQKNNTKTKRTYVLVCTKSGCKGMLSSENVNSDGNYICAICNEITCSDCKMGIQTASHVCDPDILKTVQHIDSTSKPCPSCGIPIHKISGCFASGTIIPLADGTNVMANEIETNHKLIGDDGSERVVLSTTTGVDQLYMIHQSNGCSYEVNTYHTLCLMKENGQIVLMTMNVYLDLPIESKSKLFGYKIINGDIVKSTLEVIPTRVAIYHGFAISDNRRFVLQDGTVVHNCSQMFCTSCHASFDWTSLRLNTGSVHNPHHAEWLRANRNRPRELGDIQCGREITINIATRLSDAFHTYCAKLPDGEIKNDLLTDGDYLFEAMRVCIHHTHVSIVSLGTDRRGQGHRDNHYLRMNVLMNTMSEADFKREIQKRDKASSKKNDLLHVVMTYRDAVTDIVWPLYVSTMRKQKKKSLEEWVSTIHEVRALEQYVNECFARVAETYGTSVQYTIMSDRTIR